MATRDTRSDCRIFDGAEVRIAKTIKPARVVSDMLILTIASFLFQLSTARGAYHIASPWPAFCFVEIE